ncbi:DMT family transporter [Methylobacterium dankookense]|uniref:Inner membrane protein YdcZ n=1 Tax=Methylobacterium dankookense TaxID=560405 RepID=A0A564G793_9HYPH|nr:DMT family transporter [Methylobacterium dankookense]GJD57222.1 hypothetical protein IFDJLNFL_3122 [Methylobacterium dankookense]VUF15710.1 hypothetical protein MTDSW087_05455 [Methylobacterium dankookense]
MAYLYLAAVLVGVANAIQPGMTETLARALGQPLLAALVSMLTGVTLYLTFGLATGRLRPPRLEEAAAAPWWAWAGGVLGALLVLSQVFVAPRIGAGRYIGLSVTAAILTSIALDHFGLLGFQQHPAGLWRILGGVLMVAGVTLVAVF